jgi:ribose transport system ATP-binding protein
VDEVTGGPSDAAPVAGGRGSVVEPVLSAIGVSKTFGAATVLRAADLRLSAGRVRGLLGQNGSGKSTFIKILAGYHAPDPGCRLIVRGQDVPLPVQSSALKELGIGFMHQDLALDETMTVVENYLLDGRGSLAPIQWPARRRHVHHVLSEFGLEIDVTTPVARLTPGQRAVVALARAVRHVGDDNGILVLDEPTASLDRDGVDLLMGAVMRLRSRGAAILFVGHNIQEALQLCDDITILRDGVVVADMLSVDTDEATVIRTIVGRDIGDVYPDAHARPLSDVVVEVTGLSGRVVKELDLTIHRGEIVGLTGLAGMGHNEVPELLFGHHQPHTGTVLLDGAPLPPDPRDCLREGVVLISGDRKRVGAHPGASVETNVSLPVLHRYFHRGALRHRSMRVDVARMLAEFDVRPPVPTAPMGQLSGGNQQKAIVGKWLSMYGSARVLLLTEPVQGVDVAARQAIFRYIREAADRGLAVLYVSSEHEDLAHLCDRVLVVREGRLQNELHGAALTAHQLTAACLRAA